MLNISAQECHFGGGNEPLFRFTLQCVKLSNLNSHNNNLRHNLIIFEGVFVMDTKLVDTIKKILTNKEMSGEYEHDGKNKNCFISAYQLAIFLDKNHRPLLDSLGYPKNIGGKGLGKHDSLAKRIARDLSAETKNNLQFDIEIAFFCTNELEQFSFRDEEHILREASNSCFSMFRCKAESEV